MKIKTGQERSELGGRILAIGDEKMGKTYKLQELSAIWKLKNKDNGYFEIYIDTNNDTTRYSYYDSYTRIKSLEEINIKPDNAYILDLGEGGTLANFLNGNLNHAMILRQALLIIERVHTRYPKMAKILFVNEIQYFFPNVQYTGKDIDTLVRLYALTSIHHIGCMLFANTQDLRNTSKQLVARSDSVLAFSCNEPNALNALQEIATDISSGVVSKDVLRLQKLKQREFIMLKGNLDKFKM